jgi:hypothetical protein
MHHHHKIMHNTTKESEGGFAYSFQGELPDESAYRTYLDLTPPNGVGYAGYPGGWLIKEQARWF